MQPAGLVMRLSESVNKEAWLHVSVFLSGPIFGTQKRSYTLPAANTLPEGPL